MTSILQKQEQIKIIKKKRTQEVSENLYFNENVAKKERPRVI